ncbi:MAG: hypothetical protein WBR29_08580 [Gammaproteobacteria bacterium]
MTNVLQLRKENDAKLKALKAESRAQQIARENAARERNQKLATERFKGRIRLPIEDGCVFISSDAHYYGQASVSHKASLLLAAKLKPWAIINNGDAIDGASISRWPVGSFTEMSGRPSVYSEIGEASARLAEYEQLPSVKFRVWNMGNHDSRFESRLAEKVPEFAGVDGFTLKEHFPEWLPAWRTDMIASDGNREVVIQHRFKGGMHAGQNNVLWSGTNYVTGHDHMLKAYSITNVHGLHWGIHAGTMAPIDSKLFLHYTEDRPVNWQEGFSILWFRNGRFVGPELVHCTPDGRAIFRGDILKL